ncbi:MAG: hypothetical protein HYZ28_29015 [Myxococcales bacterium]|nr:hypothetical protein [Myxococcales bacterium]
MREPDPHPLLENRLDIHDRKQFEIKLECQPSGREAHSRYLVEMFAFLPASLNVDQDTYPRESFYADIHNYVRLKTPVLAFREVLTAEHSPLSKLERRVEAGQLQPESELVYQAKMLSCVVRGALRRFVREVKDECGRLVQGGAPETELEKLARESVQAVKVILERFRALTRRLSQIKLQEKTRASLRLVDEYLSLSVEQFFRKAVADMDRIPRTGPYLAPRKELMAQVIDDEHYRKENQLRSVISPTGDNEEYMHRIGFLKKFCMNILFLSVRREAGRTGWEEGAFAMAAGLAMAFATAVAFAAQERFHQASLNFFLILVVGYMLKDRIKEGLRRIFAAFASRHLFDRATRILDPVTKDEIGVCKEKVDYGRAARVPKEIQRLRQTDDFITVSQGELAETAIRYQKQVVLDSELLPKMGGGIASGVTDIIRLNVDRLLRDMDDPEYALEYVDLEDFSVGRVRAAKSYQVDLAFRFSVEDGKTKGVSLQLVRLVLDRNGIKRMLRFEPPALNLC